MIKTVGDFMKEKVIVFIFIISSMAVVFWGLVKTKETVEQFVFEETSDYTSNVNDIKELVKNEYDFSDFYLLFDDYHLSTKNMESLFSFFINRYEYKIITVYPYVNSIYKNVLNNINLTYKGSTLIEGINNLYKDYLHILESNDLDDEIDKLYQSGLGIKIIHMNTSNLAMYNFLNEYKNIKYSLSFGETFKSI
jgi:hypothetical protein